MRAPSNLNGVLLHDLIKATTCIQEISIDLDLDLLDESVVTIISTVIKIDW
jgi:hypothetical protein